MEGLCRTQSQFTSRTLEGGVLPQLHLSTVTLSLSDFPELLLVFAKQL